MSNSEKIDKRVLYGDGTTFATITMENPSILNITDGITEAKSLIRTKVPYIIDKRHDGSEQVIFSEHFITVYRQALSFNCVNNMTKKEKDLYFEYIQYTKYPEQFDIRDLEYENKRKVFIALDKWTIDELAEIPHPEQVLCDENA